MVLVLSSSSMEIMLSRKKRYQMHHCIVGKSTHHHLLCWCWEEDLSRSIISVMTVFHAGWVAYGTFVYSTLEGCHLGLHPQMISLTPADHEVSVMHLLPSLLVLVEHRFAPMREIHGS